MLPAQTVKKESFREKVRKLFKKGARSQAQPESGAQQPLKQDEVQPKPAIAAPIVANKAVNRMATVSATSSGSLTIYLKNDTNSSNVYAYISEFASFIFPDASLD